MSPRIFKNFLQFLASLGIPFVFLSVVLVGLKWGWGWMSLETQFLGYRGSVAAVGPDPRLPVVGISFSPLLIFGTALLRSPLLVQSVLGSVLLLGWWRWLEQLPVGRGWRWLWGMLMVVQPSFVFMLVRSPSWIAIAGLLGASMALLLSLSQVGQTAAAVVSHSSAKTAIPLSKREANQDSDSFSFTLELTLLGFSLATLMLLRWESWWLLPWVVLLMLLVFRQESWAFRGTVALVTSFMSLMVILGWLYVNWLASGDPWAFTYQLDSGLRLPQFQSWLISAGRGQGLVEAGAWLGAVVPAYVLVGVAAFLAKGSGRWIWAMVWACPIVLLVASFRQGLFLPELSRFGMFWVLMPLVLGSYLQKGRVGWVQQWGITAALLLSWLSSGYLLTHTPLIPEEQDLGQRLGLMEASQLVQGWQQQRQEQQQVGQYLKQHLLPGQRVLVDDALHFEAIFWAGDPHLFVTPHQYEFSIALQHPQKQVDYLLFSGPQHPFSRLDRLLQFWPQLALEPLGFLPGDSLPGLPGCVHVYGGSQVQLLGCRVEEVL
ncbi:MAG: hypothetical protein ACUVRV_07825 [Cyanobacteriota bacterium]